MQIALTLRTYWLFIYFRIQLLISQSNYFIIFVFVYNFT